MIRNQNLLIARLGNYNGRALVHRLSKIESMLNRNTSSSSGENPNLAEASQKEPAGNIDDLYPIYSLEQLTKLEQSLADHQRMQECAEKLSVICGKSGNGNGLNNCYILVDRMFTRKFMTLCSWAGGARNKTEKIPFKVFKNTIQLFFSVVHLSDQNFTLNECEGFFKTVIKNSTARSESLMVKKSQIKRRPKHLTYNKVLMRRAQRMADRSGSEMNTGGEIEGESQEDAEVIPKMEMLEWCGDNLLEENE